MITVNDEHVAQMRAHGERDYPYECCGLMLGRFESGLKQVLETYAISNAREEAAKRNRFLIRPEELMHGEKYAREKGFDVVGFYHSHPDDVARAVDLRSWEMESDRTRFNEEEIVSEARA